MTTVVSVPNDPTSTNRTGWYKGTITDIPVIHMKGPENSAQGQCGFIGTNGIFYPFASTGVAVPTQNLAGTIVGNPSGTALTVTPSGGSGVGYTFQWSTPQNASTQPIVGASNTASIVIGPGNTSSLFKVRITDSLGNIEDVYFTNIQIPT